MLPTFPTTPVPGHRWALGLVLLVGTLLMVGPPARAQAPPPPSVPAEAAAVVYTVGTGDVLAVRVYGEDRLSDDYVVGPKGDIELPWIGRVDVSGQTTEQVADRLVQRYGDGFLVSPEIVVEVKQFGSRPVQVLGAVANQGTYHLRGDARLISVIAEAGGVKVDGDLATYEVQVKRPRIGAVEPTTVSLDRLMNQGEGNIQVEAGDVINITRGKVVFVSGQVAKPGVVPWRTGVTVTQAVAATGGASKLANLRKVIVMRGEQRLEVNLKNIHRGREPDLPLKPGDQIIIDESPI